MTLLWPWLALLGLIGPFLLGLYFWTLRRRRRFAVRYSSLTLIREALPGRSRWRRYVPLALFLLALTSLSLAAARPAALVTVPLNRTTIILALDVSRSMCATDVAPNRLTVAQEAALAFIQDQADSTQIGLVAFAGFAEIIVPPTNDRTRLAEAVRNLTTSIGTAIGSATLKSIDAIAEINPAVEASGLAVAGEGAAPGSPAVAYVPEIIVLLTDGANSQGPLPLAAAQQAANRRLRVYTIGFGTTEPQEIVCTERQLGSDAFGGGFGGGIGGGFGGGGFGGFRRFLVLDEDTLRGVADLTGGAYFRAENADQLFEVFLDLPSQISLQQETRELSAVFALIGAVLAAMAIGLSFRWHRLP